MSKNTIIGKNSKGRYYDVYTHYAFCEGRGLTELVIEGCASSVYCDSNELTKLEYPDSVETLWCDHNKLTELRLSRYLKVLICDKELFDYDTCEVNDVSIIYTDRETMEI